MTWATPMMCEPGAAKYWRRFAQVILFAESTPCLQRLWRRRYPWQRLVEIREHSSGTVYNQWPISLRIRPRTGVDSATVQYLVD